MDVVDWDGKWMRETSVVQIQCAVPRDKAWAGWGCRRAGKTQKAASVGSVRRKTRSHT